MSTNKNLKSDTARHNYDAYSGQLAQAIAPIFHEQLYDIYKACHEAAVKTNKDTLTLFQQAIAGCDKFTDQTLEPLYIRTLQQVPWLREVVRQMVTQQVFLLMSSRGDRPNSKIEGSFELPEDTQIIRHMFCTVCRYMRSYVMLYDHTISAVQFEANTATAEKHVDKILRKFAFPRLVPIERIVEAHFRAEPEPEPEPQPEIVQLLIDEQPADASARLPTDPEPEPIRIEVAEPTPAPKKQFKLPKLPMK